MSGAQASEYQIISNFTLPRGLKPGVAIKFSLVFKPPSSETAGVKTGLFTILTTSQQSKSVRLRGIATTGLSGSNEPSLQRILDLYQIPDNVGDSNPNDDALNEPPLTPNSELNIETLVKAGAGSVTAYPIAEFAQVVNPSILFGYNVNSKRPARRRSSSPSPTPMPKASIPTPPARSPSTPAQPPSALYVTLPRPLAHRIQPIESPTPGKSNVADRRKARFYPLKNKDGTLVPNSYVVAFEDLTAATGVDFQDGVFVIQNVKPAT